MASGTFRLSGLWPPFAEVCRIYLSWCDHYGITVTVVSGHRSLQEQARLYSQGRTAGEIRAQVRKRGAGGSVTDAPPGSSPHNYGLAIDIESPRLSDARQVAQEMGFGLVSWDLPHLEWPNWRALLQ